MIVLTTPPHHGSAFDACEVMIWKSEHRSEGSNVADRVVSAKSEVNTNPYLYTYDQYLETRAASADPLDGFTVLLTV